MRVSRPKIIRWQNAGRLCSGYSFAKIRHNLCMILVLFCSERIINYSNNQFNYSNLPFIHFRSRGHTNADTRAYWNSQWGSISLSGLYTTAVQNVASQISARAWQKEALQIGCVLATDCIALLAA